MIKREIEISGKKVPFRSSATIPRLYRAKFKRDIFKDLSKLEKSYRGKTENGEELQIEDLEIFENVAYVMAYHADNSIPANIEDCLLYTSSRLKDTQELASCHLTLDRLGGLKVVEG